jgi:hypothetical protein
MRSFGRGPSEARANPPLHGGFALSEPARSVARRQTSRACEAGPRILRHGRVSTTTSTAPLSKWFGRGLSKHANNALGERRSPSLRHRVRALRAGAAP